MHTEKSRAFWLQRHYLCFEKEGRGIQPKEQCSHNETWRKEYYAVRIFLVHLELGIFSRWKESWMICEHFERKPQEPSFDMTEHAYFTSGENLPPEDLNDHYWMACTKPWLESHWKCEGGNLRPRPRPEDQYRWRSSKDLPKKNGLVLFRGDTCETC